MWPRRPATLAVTAARSHGHADSAQPRPEQAKQVGGLVVLDKLERTIHRAIASSLRRQLDPPARIAFDHDETVSVNTEQEVIRYLQSAAILEFDDQIVAGADVARQIVARHAQKEVHAIFGRSNDPSVRGNGKIAQKA